MLPKPSIPQNEWPRTVAYHRLGAGMNITLRTDIAQDLDYMILNIGREGASWPPITLINIYNQKSPNPTTGTAQEWMADQLLEHIPSHSTPTIIAGDWNMRDPSWDNGVQAPDPHMRETLEWLCRCSFKLVNEPNVPTREDSSGHTTTIDLIFANDPVLNAGILTNTIVNTEISCLSDHHALAFTIGPPCKELHNPPDNGLNWKHADEESFCNALKNKIEADHDTHTRIMRDILNQNRKTASEHELDKLVTMIQRYLEQAAAKLVLAQ